ncbi:retinol-binding protein 5 [Synchiropus splendidus]|uniref:retinol-binding protein 5 n=1 Tax=Synchiropus splendidus TaxID=270530 RepID=UPI00237EB04E|nr:retinol-binding protein 5 [Synchiropus splendidus]
MNLLFVFLLRTNPRLRLLLHQDSWKIPSCSDTKLRAPTEMSKPDYSGVYHMVEQKNMDEYLAALDINIALRKIVCLLRPSKDISHDPASGAMKIRTLTTFRNFDMDFTIGQEFTEDLGPVDGRKCQTTVSWDGDKLVCVQRGEKEGRGWTHWLDNDHLHLEMRVQGVVAKQVFKKAN